MRNFQQLCAKTFQVIKWLLKDILSVKLAKTMLKACIQARLAIICIVGLKPYKIT